jgi:NitT/TauT family transport system substrate-binding protein
MNRSFTIAKRLIATLVVMCATTTGANGTDKVTLQLKWLPQAQFAGYYVAQSKGYYKAEGLEVIIKPGGPDIQPVKAISSHSADVVVNWMPDSLAARERGVPLVNIAQVFNQSGLMLTCRKSSGVYGPKDFKGKRLGVWYGGNELPLLKWMADLGYKTNTDIKIIKQGFNVDLLLQNQADCISTMIYNEYWQLLDAGIKESELITFFYEKMEVATLEDGLYVLEARLADTAFVARMSRFLRASFKGWNDAVKNPTEAARLVVMADTSGKADEKVQIRQMLGVSRLITNAGMRKIGYLEPAAYERTVRVLMASGNTSVIRKAPDKTAYTHAVWEAAQK